MEVGSVSFKINIDLSELDAQLKKASRQIEKSLDSINLTVGANAGKTRGVRVNPPKEDCCDELKRVNANIIAYGKQQNKLLNDIKRSLATKGQKIQSGNLSRLSSRSSGEKGVSRLSNDIRSSSTRNTVSIVGSVSRLSNDIRTSSTRNTVSIVGSANRASTSIVTVINRSSSLAQKSMSRSSTTIASSVFSTGRILSSGVGRSNSLLREVCGLLGEVNSLLDGLKKDLPDSIGKAVRRYSKDGLIMSVLKAPFKMLKAGVGGATQDIFRGFFENIGENISAGFGVGGKAKAVSKKIKHYMDLTDEYLIGGIDNYLATFIAEITKSGSFESASKKAMASMRIFVEHLPRFRQMLDLSGMLDGIRRGEDVSPEIKALLLKQRKSSTRDPSGSAPVWKDMDALNESIQALQKDPGSMKSAFSFSLALFDPDLGLINKTKPKELVHNYINPILKELSAITGFIGKIQQFRAIDTAKSKMAATEALFPKLEEGQKGYLQVIGGAVQRRGIGGGYTLETLLEPLVKERKIIPVSNPDTDPAGNEKRDPFLASVLKTMKESFPDIFGNQELYNTLLNGITMTVQTVNPMFESEAVSTALANIMVALKKGVSPEDIGTVSYSLGGKEARTLADALDLLKIKVKTLALAFPEINASQTKVPNFMSTLITPDALGSIKNVMEIGGMQNMKMYTPNVPPSSEAHAPKHYFKLLQQILEFFEFLNIEAPTEEQAKSISEYLSTAENFSEKLTNIAQAQSLGLTGKLDPYKVAQGIGFPTHYDIEGKDIINNLLESVYKRQAFKAIAEQEDTERFSPEIVAIMKKMLETQNEAYDALEKKLVEVGFAQPTGATREERAAELFGQLKLRQVLEDDLEPVIRAIESGTYNKGYFVGNLDPQEMVKRSMSAVMAANWFGGEGSFPSESYVKALVDGFRTIRTVALEFQKSGGATGNNMSPELRNEINKANELMNSPTFMNVRKEIGSHGTKRRDTEGESELVRTIRDQLSPLIWAIENNEWNNTWFVGDLNPDLMIRRKVDTDTAVDYFTKRQGAVKYQDARIAPALAEVFKTIGIIITQFYEDSKKGFGGGNLSEEMKEVLESAKNLPFFKTGMEGYIPEDAANDFNKLFNQKLKPEEMIARNFQRKFTEAVPGWLSDNPASAMAYNQIIRDFGGRNIIPPISDIYKSSTDKSGVNEFFNRDLIFKNATDYAKTVASKGEIKAYEVLAGRYSPLMHGAIEGKALITEKRKGEIAQVLLDELVEKLRGSQKKIEKMKDSLGEVKDEKQQEKMTKELQKEELFFSRKKEEFNNLVAETYQAIGRLSKTLTELGVLHGNLTAANIMLTPDKLPVAINLENARVDFTDADVVADQLSTLRKALTNFPSDILDIPNALQAMVQGFQSEAFPEQEKRTGSMENLPRYSDVKPIELGSNHPGLLDFFLNYKDLAKKITEDRKIAADAANAIKEEEERIAKAAKEEADRIAKAAKEEADRIEQEAKAEREEIARLQKESEALEAANKAREQSIAFMETNRTLIQGMVNLQDAFDITFQDIALGAETAIGVASDSIRSAIESGSVSIQAAIATASETIQEIIPSIKIEISGPESEKLANAVSADIGQQEIENIQKWLKERTSILAMVGQDLASFNESEIVKAIQSAEGIIKGIDNLKQQNLPKQTVDNKNIGKVLGGYKGQVVIRLNQLQKELESRGAEIGKNLSEGLAEGISPDQIEQIAASITEPLIETIEEDFEIKSPSDWARRIGEYIVSGLSNGLQTSQQELSSWGESIQSQIGAAFESLRDTTYSASEAFKENLLQMVFSSTLLVGAIGIFQEFQDAIISFGMESFNAAVEFEKIATATEFIVGSSSKAIEKIEELRESARKLGIDQLSVVESYNSLAAATRNTPLEGRNTDILTQALNQAAAAFSLSAEQVEGAFTAVQQIAGKGVVSAEELRGQLAERIPGAFQIGARAMKISERELYEMMSTGALSATDFLPALARQLKIETFSGIEIASQTTGFQLQKVQNHIQDIQISVGEKLLPIAKAGLKVVNAGLGALSDNLDKIFNYLKTALTFVAVHFTKLLIPALQLIAPHVKFFASQVMAKIVLVLSNIIVGTNAWSKALFVLNHALSAINNSTFLKISVVFQGIGSAYTAMRTVFGAFDISDNPLFAEQTVWDELAKRVKKTTESIKKDIKALDKEIKATDFFRDLEQKDIFEKVASYLSNQTPFIKPEDAARRRQDALRATNEGRIPNKILGFNFQPYDRGGRISSYASMREDDYVMDLERRTKEIDAELNLSKIYNDLAMAKQGTGNLMKIKSIDELISGLTARKSLLEPSDIEARNSISESINKLQEEREKIATAYTIARTGLIDGLKTIDSELETVTDPQAIAQLELLKTSWQQVVNLMDKHEAIHGPISSTKKFALALQELNFAFEAIAENADRVNTSMERSFLQQRVADFSSNYFSGVETAAKESRARYKNLESEIIETRNTIKRIAANMEYTPAYREALLAIENQEKEMGRILLPADLEYFKEKVASSENQDLINAIDSEIKLRTQVLELEQKLLEKDQLSLEIREQREQVALAGIEQSQKNADMHKQILEIRNREILSRMAMENRKSEDISASEALLNESAIKQSIDYAKIIKTSLKSAFAKGNLSAREYQDRLQEVNLELLDLNAGLKEAKLQSRDALDARFLAAVESQIEKASHIMNLNQINRESHAIVNYINDVETLNSSQAELAKVTRESENQIANLNEQMGVTRRTLEVLSMSNSKSPDLESKIKETKREIETYTAELLQAQLQANQSIKEAQQQMILDDLERFQSSLEHQNSIFEITKEYELLGMQLALIESLNPMASFDYESAVATSEVEKLNSQLGVSIALLESLSTSGVNTPEVRDRINDIKKEIEIQEHQIEVEKRRAQLEIDSARQSAILDRIDKEQIAIEHGVNIAQLNKEYELLDMELTAIGSKNPLAILDHEAAIANSEFDTLNSQLNLSIKLLNKLSTSGINTSEVRGRISETEREIEAQKAQIRIEEKRAEIARKNAKLEIETAKQEALLAKIDKEHQTLEHLASIAELNKEYKLLGMQLAIINSDNPLATLDYETASLGATVDGLNSQFKLSLNLLDKLLASGIDTSDVTGRIEDIKKQIEAQKLQIQIEERKIQIEKERIKQQKILAQIDKDQANLEHATSLSKLKEEYELLGMQLTAAKSKNPLDILKYETATAKTATEDLNSELKLSTQLLTRLAESGINTPEVTDRIDEIKKQIELQKAQIKIEERRMLIEKEDEKAGIKETKSEAMSREIEKFLRLLDLQKEQQEHQRALTDINIEYQKAIRTRKSLLESSQLNSFSEAIKTANNEIKRMTEHLNNNKAILIKLEKSGFKSQEIDERIRQTKKEIEVQTAQLLLQREQNKIDLIEALDTRLTTLEKINKEIENQNKLLDNQSEILTATKEILDAIASVKDANLNQKITAASEITSRFENIGITSKELFEAQLKLNDERINNELKSLKEQLRYDEKSLDIAREKALLERKSNNAEINDRLIIAQQNLEAAYGSKDKDLINIAEENLGIVQEEIRLLKQQERAEDLIYSKQKESLAIKSDSQLKIHQINNSALVYENTLKRIDFIIKGINSKIDSQKTFLESYQKLFAARSEFLQNKGSFNLQQINVGVDIIKQLSNQEISEPLRRELEKQASLLGVSGKTESELLIKAFQSENELAKERLKTLKEQQKIDQALLNLDLKKAELDAKQAVIQSKILSSWAALMGLGDTSGLIEDALANLDFIQEQGNMARQAQAISQASELNRMIFEDWMRQLQQRREITGTDGFEGNLGSLPRRPRLLNPNLNIPKPENDRYKPMNFPEEKFIPEFSKMNNGIEGTNKLLEEIKEIMQRENQRENNDVNLTVVSSNAVADAGKILNDITKPF